MVYSLRPFTGIYLYVSNEFITRERPGKVIRSIEARTADLLQMSREHVSLELRPKTSKTVSNAYNEGRLF